MASIQFRSIADTVSAFDKLDCDVWSLWDGKRFMFKGAGSDELQAFLDLMNNNGSTNAAYILAYYEGVKDASAINSKTAYDGSFTFKLNSDGTEITTGQYRSLQNGNELQSRVAGIEHKLDLLIASESEIETEESGNRLGVIGEIIAHPAIAPLLPVLVEKIVSSIFSSAERPAVPMPAVPLRKVSGIETQSVKPANDAAKSDLLRKSVERLLKADPELPLHLSKLADMSERDPNGFNYIVKMLETLPA
jgi:hypothetical protein